MRPGLFVLECAWQSPFEDCQSYVMKSLEETPIYESRRFLGNLWGRYLVYRDRIELRSMVGVFRIPYPDLVRIDRRGPGLKGLREAKSLAGIKLDCSDLVPHLLLERRSGMAKFIRFTPDDIDAFLAAAQAAKSRWRG
jgi:hypothetical protein